MILSKFAGIDDFSCSSNWNATKSLWTNAGNMIERDKQNESC